VVGGGAFRQTTQKFETMVGVRSNRGLGRIPSSYLMLRAALFVMGVLYAVVLFFLRGLLGSDDDTAGSVAKLTPMDDNHSFEVVATDCLFHVRGKQFYSQYNEDGALLDTLKCMGGNVTKEYFEFGSEDGMQVNTRVLREVYGWKGHLLDGGHENPEISLHKEFFTPSNIVSLLEKYKVTKTLDLLSIDCDYDDFFIMREILVAGYAPRVLITEYNSNFGDEWAVSTLPKPVGREGEVGWRFDCYQGASASALIMLGQVFGYTPVWSNGINLIFVRLALAHRLDLAIPPPQKFPTPGGIASVDNRRTGLVHADCSNKTWKLIDSNNANKASESFLSHAEWSGGFSEVELGVQTNKGWRSFYKIDDEET
jgi:hypothetical protein